VSSLNKNLGLGYVGWLVLDPAHVIRFDVVPARLKLVTHGPHEVSLDLLVEDIESALTKSHDLIIGVEVRVDGAHTLLDGGVIAVQARAAVRAGASCGAIEVGTLGRQVGLGALDALAGAAGISVSIVEASEPGGAHIGGEGPLTNPDVVLNV